MSTLKSFSETLCVVLLLCGSPLRPLLLFFRLHFSAQTSVAYNKTVLWKHLGVLTDNDKFKYQHRDMTKRASKATCHRSHKPYEQMEAKLELPTLSPWPGWQRSVHLQISAKVTELSMSADLAYCPFRSQLLSIGMTLEILMVSRSSLCLHF